MSVEQLEREIDKLTVRERARLAERILEGLAGADADEAVEKAWIAEAGRRQDEMASGRIEGVPVDEALRKARERLL